MYSFILVTGKESGKDVLINMNNIISARDDEYGNGGVIVLRDDKCIRTKEDLNEIIKKIDATCKNNFEFAMWYWNNKKEK